MTQCRLRDVPVGGMARVVGIDDTHRSYRSRILSMGLTRGTPIFVQRIAPLGDPIHITVRDFELSLRRDEADALILEPIEGEPEAFGFCARCRGRGRWRKGMRARLGRRGRGLGRGDAAGNDGGGPGPRGRGRRFGRRDPAGHDDGAPGSGGRGFGGLGRGGRHDHDAAGDLTDRRGGHARGPGRGRGSTPNGSSEG